MIKFHLVKNFRKKAGWTERLFANFLLIAGDIKIAFRENLLNKDEYSKMAGKLKPGDLVFAGSKREMSRFFLRGDLTHSLIYIGKKKFIHSGVKNGVEGIYLKELFDKYDFLEAYRCTNFSIERRRRLMDFLLKSYGKAYDFRFLKGNKEEFYCTKLIELGYKEAGVKIRKRDGGILPYISTTHPEDFMLHDFKLVFSSDSIQQKREWTYSVVWKILLNTFRLSW